MKLIARTALVLFLLVPVLALGQAPDINVSAGHFRLAGRVQSPRPVIIPGAGAIGINFALWSGGLSFPMVCASAQCVDVLNLSGQTVLVTGRLSRDEATGALLLKAMRVTPQ